MIIPWEHLHLKKQSNMRMQGETLPSNVDWETFKLQPEFNNVNCRFCGAIHSIDWACISGLLQVIHSINEKKNRTDKYYFLCELWR